LEAVLGQQYGRRSPNPTPAERCVLEAVLDLDDQIDALRPVAAAKPLARGGRDLSKASLRLQGLHARRIELLANLSPKRR
jgi:hypothetical protein